MSVTGNDIEFLVWTVTWVWLIEFEDVGAWERRTKCELPYLLLNILGEMNESMECVGHFRILGC